MHRPTRALALILLLPACTQTVHVGAPVPATPGDYERINEDVRRGRSVVELEDRVVRGPLALRIDPDSVRWWERGVEHRVPTRDLERVRISERQPTVGERFVSAVLSTLVAGTAMTTYHLLTEEGGGAPGFAGGLMINTFLLAPLAAPAGFVLAPHLMGRTIYEFRGTSDASR